MTAVMVNGSKLKIKLDADEAYKFFKNTTSVSCYDPEVRHVLKAILKKALCLTEFTLDCEKFKVELFPSAGGGCIIFFTKSPVGKRYRKNPDTKFRFLLGFSDSNDVISASKSFNSRLVGCDKSSLYKLYDRYYLLVTSRSGKFFSSPLIKEFADSLQCSDTAAAIVSEYGSLMIGDNAIEKLATI